MRLARKITLLFLAPFAVLLVLLAYRSTQRELGIYKSQIANDLLLTGRAIRPAFREVWRVEGEARALEVLAIADHDVADVKIRWVPRERMPSLGNHVGESPIVQNDPGGVGRVIVWLPLVDERVPPGAIELIQTLDQEETLSRDLVHRKIGTTIGAVVISIVVGSIVGIWFIGKPVRSLVRHAQRIGKGDFSRVLGGRRRDELGELANGMNSMCDQLAGARQSLMEETEARIRALEQVRHADRLSTVGKLAAGVAHELGTPLNVVSGRAKMITSGKLAPEAVAENATIIGGQAARMTKIIRGLLDFARQGAAKKGTTDLSELATNALALLAPLSKKRGVSIRLEGGEIPQILEVDAGQIEQVLTNLVVNAVDATPDGGAVVVRLAEQPVTPPAGHDGKHGLYLRIEVRDQGTGICTEDLARVFEPFFTTKEVGAGTGLGLSVAHGIVHDHGGWIAAESEPNRGSCFSVYLPKTHS